MTEEEIRIIKILALAWNDYLKLEELHPNDRDEFMRAIHAAQNIVLARTAERELKSKDATIGISSKT